MQTSSAEVIASAFEHRELEFYGQDLLQHRQILLRELFLEIDRVGGNHRFFLVRHRIQNRRNEVSQAFTDASPCFDGQMLPLFEGPRHRHGHLLLLRAKLEILRLGQDTGGRKDFLDLFDQVESRASGLILDKTNHCDVGRVVVEDE